MPPQRSEAAQVKGSLDFGLYELSCNGQGISWWI